MVAQLRPGSIVVVVGEMEKWDLDIAKERDITVLNIALGKQPQEAAVGEIPFVKGQDSTTTILWPMLSQVFGRVIQRPKIHFQIDVIVLAHGCPDEGLLQLLLEYLHPGGWVFSSRAIPTLGTELARQETWIIYQPEIPPESIHFAKMRALERRWLYEQVRSLPSGSVYVEIGSYKGGSAVIAALANPHIRIYCVDPWLDKRRLGIRGVWASFDFWQRHTQFFQNVFAIPIDLAHPEGGVNHIADMEKMPLKELQITFLFIDGDHSFSSVRRDLELYAPHTRDMICGHDYCYGPVRQAVNWYFGGALRRFLARAIPNRLWQSRFERYWRDPRLRFTDEESNLWCVEMEER